MATGTKIAETARGGGTDPTPLPIGFCWTHLPRARDVYPWARTRRRTVYAANCAIWWVVTSNQPMVAVGWNSERFGNRNLQRAPCQHCSLPDYTALANSSRSPRPRSFSTVSGRKRSSDRLAGISSAIGAIHGRLAPITYPTSSTAEAVALGSVVNPTDYYRRRLHDRNPARVLGCVMTVLDRGKHRALRSCRRER